MTILVVAGNCMKLLVYRDLNVDAWSKVGVYVSGV